MAGSSTDVAAPQKRKCIDIQMAGKTKRKLAPSWGWSCRMSEIAMMSSTGSAAIQILSIRPQGTVAARPVTVKTMTAPTKNIGDANVSGSVVKEIVASTSVAPASKSCERKTERSTAERAIARLSPDTATTVVA